MLDNEILKILHSRSTNGKDVPHEFTVQYIGGRDVLTGDRKKLWRMCMNDGTCYKTAIFNAPSSEVYDQARSLTPFSVVRITLFAAIHHYKSNKKFIFFALKKFSVVTDGSIVSRVLGAPTFNVDGDDLLGSYLPVLMPQIPPQDNEDVNTTDDVEMTDEGEQMVEEDESSPSSMVDQVVTDKTISIRRAEKEFEVLRNSQEAEEEHEPLPIPPEETREDEKMDNMKENNYETRFTAVEDKRESLPMDDDSQATVPFGHDENTVSFHASQADGPFRPSQDGSLTQIVRDIKSEIDVYSPHLPTQMNENFNPTQPQGQVLDQGMNSQALIAKPTVTPELSENIVSKNSMADVNPSSLRLPTPVSETHASPEPSLSQIMTNVRVNGILSPLQPTLSSSQSTTSNRNVNILCPLPNLGQYLQEMRVPLYHIGSLNTERKPYDFRVIGRLVKLSPIISTHSGCEWIQLLLQDQSGKITMKIWGDHINRLAGDDLSRLRLGKVYEICRPFAKDVESRYFREGKVDGHIPVELTANNATTIEERASEDLEGVPKFSYNFTKIADINDVPEGKKIDVLGVVIHQVHYEEPWRRRLLTLRDKSNAEIILIIWNWWGSACAYDDLIGKVVALKNAEVDYFHGKRLRLNNEDSSLVIEPNLEEAILLKEWNEVFGVDALVSSLAPIRSPHGSPSKEQKQ